MSCVYMLGMTRFSRHYFVFTPFGAIVVVVRSFIMIVVVIVDIQLMVLYSLLLAKTKWASGTASACSAAASVVSDGFVKIAIEIIDAAVDSIAADAAHS